MGRKIRIPVPVVLTQLNPSWPDLWRLKRREQSCRLNQWRSFNRGHREQDLPHLDPGDQVCVKDTREKATVLQLGRPGATWWCWSHLLTCLGATWLWRPRCWSHLLTCVMVCRPEQHQLVVITWTICSSRPHPVRRRHMPGDIRLGSERRQGTCRTLWLINGTLSGESGRVIPLFSGGIGQSTQSLYKKKEWETYLFWVGDNWKKWWMIATMLCNKTLCSTMNVRLYNKVVACILIPNYSF